MVAGSGFNSGHIKMNFYPYDPYTLVHLFGSFFLVKLFTKLINGVDRSVLIVCALLAWICGLGWEGLDELYAGRLWFDPRGGDWADVIADLVGCALAMFI